MDQFNKYQWKGYEEPFESYMLMFTTGMQGFEPSTEL